MNPIEVLGLKGNNKFINIGSVYNGKDNSIFEVIENVKKEVDISLTMFGEEIPSIDKPIDLFILNPCKNRRNKIYDKIDIWLDYIDDDTLYLYEAMRSKCCVIGSKPKENLIDMKTGIISKLGINGFESCIKLLIDDFNLRLSLGREGSLKFLNQIL